MTKAPRKTMAILGAGGHIGRNLVQYLSASNNCQLVLFSRDPRKMTDIVQKISPCAQIHCLDYADFHQQQYDVVVNCVGLGNPADIIAAGAGIFTLTEQYDNLALDYLADHPECAYVYLSSGAVYGREFREPAGDHSQVMLPINAIMPEDYYGLAKLNAEVKHSAHRELKIIDLRIFGFFSRYVNLSAGFLLTDVVNSIKKRSLLQTSAADIVRDYVHPKDLSDLIVLCSGKQFASTKYDVYSAAPVNKFALLNECVQRFQLKYKIQTDKDIDTATGQKDKYYSVSRRASECGYQPRHTALETVMSEIAAMV